MSRLFLLVLTLASLWSQRVCYADSEKPDTSDPQILRIGGEFKIAKIKKLGDEDFEIAFESTVPSGKNDRLSLRTHHLHFGLTEGSRIRLSAEVKKASKDVLEVCQVLLFLPNESYGTTPVWVLSSQYPVVELRGPKWLEMHAPQADFEIM